MARFFVAVLLSTLGTFVIAAEPPDLAALAGKEIIGPNLTLEQTQNYAAARVPAMPEVKSVEEWEVAATKMRQETLDRVVFRGEAAQWRDAKMQVVWLETIDGGPGYRIKKVRYEALPGLWIPALLYEPEKLQGRVPVMLAVNGHDGKGKAAGYKQIRCINLAKRGMLVLNVEWFGMGQLRADNFMHYRLNQLDLCGTSGVGPFFLAMKRGIDVLLALEHADPNRVAVSGLSGGGWQTIFISSLDTRVKLANPVAGYSSFRTRAAKFSDLGDSEQTPVDLATTADYAQLTAMMAPRATLLTFNAKDNCCFKADHALPPLLEAAGPIFKLYGKETLLRSHVNEVPGTHNFEQDNREALYRMIKDNFYAGSAEFDAAEIPSDKEVKTSEQLEVTLPAENLDFHRLATELSKDLPRQPAMPTETSAAQAWQKKNRDQLSQVLRAKEYQVTAEAAGSEEKEGLKVNFWRLRLGSDWTLPAVEFIPTGAEAKSVKEAALVVADNGRKSPEAVAEIGRRLKLGQRVLAVDLWYFGESKIGKHDFLFGLLISAVGDRPLGLQASQLAAVARWYQGRAEVGAVTLAAEGPRNSVIALAAAGLSEQGIDRVDLRGSLGSLKEVLEQNRTVAQMPELFCFGLLEQFDLSYLAALAAPRKVTLHEPSERAKKEFAGLRGWYSTMGVEFSPVP
jgi:dienelactone hydrolase